jgi:hypothetical protein
LAAAPHRAALFLYPEILSMTAPLLALCAAAAGSYENFPPQFTNAAKDIHIFLSEVEGTRCFANEGTQDGLEWLVDFDAIPVPVDGMPQFGDVHQGLRDTVLSVFPAMCSYLALLGWPPFYLVGHSKGAGEVLIEGAMFKAIGHPPLMVAAFEPPMVGGPKLRAWYADIPCVVTQTRNASGPDKVTTVPPAEIWGWLHPAEPTVLIVPDSYDVMTKHRIPAVLAAVAQLGHRPLAA